MITLAQCVTLVIFLSISKCTRRPEKNAFLAPCPVFNNFPSTSSCAQQHLNTRNGASNRPAHIYNRKLQTDTALNAEATDDEGLAGFAGLGQVFNSKFLFSNDTLDQPMEDLAAREVDYIKFKGKNVKRWQQVLAVAASLVAVALLYKGLTLLKEILSRQYQELATGTGQGGIKQQSEHGDFG